MAPLDTDVKGSPASCRDTASWLTKFAGAVHRAADQIAQAHHESDSGWHGPAGDGFRDAINGVDTDLDSTVTTITSMANKLKDFASAIDAVGRTMAKARDTASKGGLTVYATIIVPPTPPGPQPQLPFTDQTALGEYASPPSNEPLNTPAPPRGPLSPQVKADIHKYQQDMNTYSQAVTAYNHKVDVFNACKHLVEDARKQEANAHHQLQQEMSEIEYEENELVAIGKAVSETMLESIKGSHEGAELLEKKADELDEAGAKFKKIAEGNLAGLTQSDIDQIKQWGDESDSLADSNREDAKALQKWMSMIPASIRDKIAANPSTLLTDSSTFLKYGKPFLKSMPYSGAVLNVMAETYEVIFEGKPVGEAFKDASVNIGSSAAGGAGGEAAASWLQRTASGFGEGFEDTAFLGSEEPGLGNVVAGTVGGVAGAVLGPEVVKHVEGWFGGNDTTEKHFTKGAPDMWHQPQPTWDPKVPRH